MKKFIPWIVVLSVLAILVIWSISGYNNMVSQEEGVANAWSQVENQYQRRADLIPNLVETVKGYAAHENTTLENVMEARAKATQITINPAEATPEQLTQYQAAQGELSRALGRLMAVSEAYPNLKADASFRDLQAQLEGTENRITIARQNFNETAKHYNTYIRKFPANLIASIFGFEKHPYFEAENGTEQAPKVQF